MGAPPAAGGKGGGAQAMQSEILARLASLEGSLSMMVELIKSFAPGAAGAASAAGPGVAPPAPMPGMPPGMAAGMPPGMMGGIDPSSMDAGMPLMPKMGSSVPTREDLVRGLVLDLLGK